MLMSKANEEQFKKYGTEKNTYKDFPVGTRVQVICKHRDFNFFDGKETGVVTKSEDGYLDIIVKFEKPYNKYHDTFNFNPQDLIVLEPKPKPTKLKETISVGEGFKWVAQPIQLSATQDAVYVLFDNGQLWAYNQAAEWKQIELPVIKEKE